jgi:hypothetical protein
VRHSRALELFFKTCGLITGLLAALFLAAVIDGFIFKPLLVTPAVRLASGQTTGVPGGYGTFLLNMLRILFLSATVISTITGAVAGVRFVYKRVSKLYKAPRGSEE